MWSEKRQGWWCGDIVKEELCKKVVEEGRVDDRVIAVDGS